MRDDNVFEATNTKSPHSLANFFTRFLLFVFAKTTLTAQDTLTSHDLSFVVQMSCYGCKWLMNHGLHGLDLIS